MQWSPVDHPKAKEKNITDKAEAQKVVGEFLKQEYKIHDAGYMTSCYTCHR
jgi:hypothetical protein